MNLNLIFDGSTYVRDGCTVPFDTMSYRTIIGASRLQEDRPAAATFSVSSSSTYYPQFFLFTTKVIHHETRNRRPSHRPCGCLQYGHDLLCWKEEGCSRKEGCPRKEGCCKVYCSRKEGSYRKEGSSRKVYCSRKEGCSRKKGMFENAVVLVECISRTINRIVICFRTDL